MRPNHKNNTSQNDFWKDASASDRWRGVVTKVLTAHGQALPLRKLYELIEPHPKAVGKQHFRARLRETLEGSATFTRIAPGVWDLSSRHSDEEVSKFETDRRERYPGKEVES